MTIRHWPAVMSVSCPWVSWLIFVDGVMSTVADPPDSVTVTVPPATVPTMPRVNRTLYTLRTSPSNCWSLTFFTLRKSGSRLADRLLTNAPLRQSRFFAASRFRRPVPKAAPADCVISAPPTRWTIARCFFRPRSNAA